jgi:hypothetical protein
MHLTRHHCHHLPVERFYTKNSAKCYAGMLAALKHSARFQLAVKSLIFMLHSCQTNCHQNKTEKEPLSSKFAWIYIRPALGLNPNAIMSKINITFTNMERLKNRKFSTTVKPVHNGIVGSRSKVRCRQVSVVYRFIGFCTLFQR